MTTYLQKCIDRLDIVSDGTLLREIGELTNEEMKTFVCTKLRTEATGLMKLYREFPIYS